MYTRKKNQKSRPDKTWFKLGNFLDFMENPSLEKFIQSWFTNFYPGRFNTNTNPGKLKYPKLEKSLKIITKVKLGVWKSPTVEYSVPELDI